LTLWLGMASMAWAAPKQQPEKEAEPTKSYVMPYIMVIAGMAVGITCLMWSSKRTDKVEARARTDEEE
jgi:hypothetical protein